jgi:hypothetical protein
MAIKASGTADAGRVFGTHIQAVLLPRKQPALRYASRVSKNGAGWLYTGLSLGPSDKESRL